MGAQDTERDGHGAEVGRRALRREIPAAALALLIFLGAGVGLLHRALLGDEVLSAAAQFARAGPFPPKITGNAPQGIECLSDSMRQFVPWLRFAVDAFRVDGRLPLWKDTAGTGAPFIGNGQSALFFPTQLLAILAGAPPSALALQALAKLVAGAFGAWLLARHLRLSFLAALLCGLVFGFGGFQVGWYLHPHTNVSLLLPWLVLAADRLVRKPSTGALAALAAVAALQHLGGHPETAFHAQVAVAALAGARIVSLRATLPRADLWRRLAWLLGGLLLGLTLGAVQVLPLLEYIGHSAILEHRDLDAPLRALTGPLTAAGFGLALLVALLALRRLARTPRALLPPALVLAPAKVAGMRAGMSSGFILSVLPEWFGSPERYMGPAAPIEWTGAFVGAAWPLVMLGLLAGRARGPVRAAGVLLGLGLLAGYSAPLVSDALQALPVFRYAVNTRLLLLALLAAAVLAGFGLDALGTLREARERRRLALAVLAPLCALFAALVCAAHLGLVAASNAPGRPEVSAITEAGLLPTAQMAPLFEGLPPPSQEEPSLAVGGWIVSAVPPMTIKLLYGSTNRSLVAQWKPAPAAAPATYVFRTAIPRSELLPERTMVRVLAIGTDGSFVVSGQLASPDDEEPWLSFPARPAPGGTPWQLALLLAVAGLLAVRPGSGLALSSVRIAFAALIGLSLLPFASGMVPLLAREMFYPHSAVIDVLREASPEGRTVCMLPSIVGPEIMTFYGVSDARSYDGMGPLHAMRLASTALGLARRSHESANAGLLDQPDLPLLGLMAVKVLTYLGPPPAGMRPVPVPAEKDPRQRYQLVENPWFLPRARLVSGAVVQADDDLALEALRDPGFPRSRCVVLAQGSPAPAAADAIGSARIVTSRPDRVRVEIAPSADGWLLLADTYFPGWVATVDGQPREIVRANVGLRAVAVHPGERVVEFRYEPASFRAGAWLSIATAIGLALASASVAWASRRRR